MRGLFFAASALLAAAPALAQSPPQLPAGEGREIVATACTQCHTPQVIMSMRKNAGAWRVHVYDMFVRGAQVTDTEIETVVDYLAANFGPGINVPKYQALALPDGAGRELVQQRCGTACHDLTRISAARHGRGDWAAVVAHMLNIGAPLTAEEGKTITAYLQRNFAEK